MAGLSVYLVGAVAQTLVDLQNEWAVQTLVLISFALQVFLLMFAWIRRHNVATLTRFLLWLAYQLADSTALFTLGHMAIRARSAAEQQLMAFWAPFLLVHLGGQDTITAYSFEDNRLWLRHLQTLVVQFLGAAYVLHKYIPHSQPLIRVASAIMFVVGALKYGERIWALRSASMDSMWSSLDTDESDSGARRRRESRRIILQELVDNRCNPLTDEDVLMASHGLLDVCKGIFIGSLRARGGEAVAACVDSVLQRCLREDRLDMLLEMELSLMYDIMYTKAAVIHTWWGCCVRVATPAATAVALLLFRVARKDGHRETDVVITYVLLAGALLLETASLVRAAVSTWTVAALHAKGKGWATDYYDDLRCLRVSLGAAGYRRWSGTVGQYSLLKSWAKDTAAPPAVGRVAELVGLGSWWHEARRWRSDKVKGLTKELLLREIFKMRADRRNVSSRPGLLALKEYQLDARFGWSVQESDVEGSIITWHVATDLYHQAAAAAADQVQGLLQASQELSRYMMFLLVVRPYMLPGPVRRSQYGSACARLNAAINAYAGDGRLDWVLRTVTQRLRNEPLTFEQVDFLHAFLGNSKFAGDNPAVAGFAIAEKLRSHPKRLQVIFGVWVEMLCFVANHCSRESHAAQLSAGGELLTIAWLMAKHANLPPTTTANDSTPPNKCKYIPSWEANLIAMEDERERQRRVRTVVLEN